MMSLALAFALMSAAQADPAIEAEMIFAMMEKYHTSFRDVSFLYEGTRSEVVEGSPDLVVQGRFQGFYAYRSDWAELLDVFSYGRGDQPASREIWAVLHRRVERIDATPDREPRIEDRVPQSLGVGGPGSLNRSDSPEMIFVAPYFSILGPAAEHEPKLQGWEDVDGHRCLKLRMLRYKRSSLKGMVGPLFYVQFWIDLKRDGYPLRYEQYYGDELERRTEITRLERLELPGGRHLWFPVEGRSTSHMGQGPRRELIRVKDPLYASSCKILLETVKFDQGLRDEFFSVKKHARLASDEDMQKLQRELERKPRPEVKVTRRPADPESRRKRLDEALAEANRQSQQLEASSAARGGAGWFEALTRGLGAFGVLLFAGIGFWYWRTR